MKKLKYGHIEILGCAVLLNSCEQEMWYCLLVWENLRNLAAKINKSADKAMAQINLNDYDKRFALYDLPRVKVGINFDTATHTLSDWKIEEA